MYVIKNATVHTMGPKGTQKLDILIEDSKIKKVDKEINLEGVKIIDAKGKVVVPGFVDAHSHIGGIASVIDDDLNEFSNPLTPSLDAYYGINRNSESFEEAIKQGITSSCLVPGSANVVGGLGFVLKSHGKNLESRLVKRGVALKAAMGINPKSIYSTKNQTPMTRMGIADILRNFLKDSKDYRDKKIENKDCKEKLPEFDFALENGMKVINKEIPLKVHCYTHDIMTVLEIAKEFDIEVTIDHGLGSSDYYEELTDSHIKGIIMGPICFPLLTGECGVLDIEACKGLDDRGVLVAVMTDGPITKSGVLLFQAGEVVRRGMDSDRALAMITINAAKIIMCDDKIGSIEEGKDADILIFDSMPTENPGAVMETVIINGEIVYENN